MTPKIAWVLVLIAAPISKAAELPDAPLPSAAIVSNSRPTPAIKPARLERRDLALYTATILANATDWISTEQCLRMPWKCHEAQLPQFIVANKVGFGVYKAGITAGTVASEYYMIHHGHPRLARIAGWANVAGCSYTDWHSYKIEDRRMVK
jgi:hypothetical protein